MGMTEQLEKIALEVAAEMPCCMNHVEIEDGVRWSKSELISFAERFLAALPKPRPFGYVCESVSQAFDSVHCGTIYSLNADDGRIPLYSEPVIAPPASEQKPVGKVIGRNFGCMPRVEWYDSYPESGSLLYTAPHPDYKAQRDALLKALDDIAWNRRPGDRRSPSALLHDAERMALAAIASVKGGE